MLTTKSTRTLPSPGRALPPDTRKPLNSSARAAGSFIPKLAAKAFERYGFHSAEIMTAWARVAGADIAAFTEPERIKWPRGHAAQDNGDGSGASEAATLVLRVDPARALDIEYRAGEIIDRINRYFGYRAIARLTIVQAPVTRTAAANATLSADGETALPPAPVSAVADPGLKNALERLWTGIAAERQKRHEQRHEQR
jgi:hypothetical protein